MSRRNLLVTAVMLAVVACLATSAMAQGTAAAADISNKGFAYPQTKKVEQVDDYHGTQVADPYRWLEDTDSADTAAWVQAENKLTFGYLEQIPERARINQRLTQLWNYERYGTPFKEGGRYFFSKNNGLQNQSVMYTVKTLDGQPTELLDPNTLSKDGTVAVSGFAPSKDGKLLAYSLSTSGSDWQEIHLRDIATTRDLPDVLKWVKFSGSSWTHDNKGFFYNRYPEPKDAALRAPNYFPKMYYHLIGTPQVEDALIYERPEQKDIMFRGGVTDDGRYLIISLSKPNSINNAVYYKDLSLKDAPVVKLLDDFDAEYHVIDNDGPVFWIHTDLKAPRYRVIAIDTRHPQRENWKEIIPESKDTISSVNTLNDMFVVHYMKDAHSAVKIFDLKGKFVREVDLPGLGTAGGFGGKRTDKETFYSFASFNNPGIIYRYDMVTGKSTVFRKPKVAFNPDDYETRQVFYPSKDGTKVPMFITSRKGIKLDGGNPTLLYAYGGFNISQMPSFSVTRLVWMEMGGVLAVANLRGGGEYGQDWHQAGMKEKKQNVFDDFIAAAEWLIASKYTSPAKLAIQGGSNGGLLVGAVMTQRPDLFGACLPAVGVMDMLRFHKFTIGWSWTREYGSSDNAGDFKAIYAYSPLHNIKPGARYPATMITTADHDDRVVPGHSFKFAATMQQAQAGAAPILIRIETKAGHGGGKPLSKTIEETSDAWAFLVKNLGMKVPENWGAAQGK